MASINDPMEDFQEQEQAQEQGDAQQQTAGGATVPEFGGGSGVADARATSGAPVGQKAALRQSSSGSFQDMSKIQKANQEKINNLATGIVTKGKETQSASAGKLESGISGARKSVTDQTKSADQFKDLNKDNVVDRFDEVKTWQGQTFDPLAFTTEGSKKIEDAYSGYSKAVDPYSQVKDSKGLQSLLKSNFKDIYGGNKNVSNVASRGDSLLLGSNQGARKGFSDLSNVISNYDARAIADKGVAGLGKDVENVVAQNKLAEEALSGRLSGINKAVQDDIARMEKAEEDRVRQEVLARMNEKVANYGGTFTDKSYDQAHQEWLDSMDMPVGYTGALNIPTNNKMGPTEYRGEIFGDGLSEGTWGDLALDYGGLDKLIGTDGLVEASNIIAGDQGLQATLNALQGLGQEGYIYDPNAQSYKDITGAATGDNTYQALYNKMVEMGEKQNELRTKKDIEKHNEKLGDVTVDPDYINNQNVPVMSPWSQLNI